MKALARCEAGDRPAAIQRSDRMTFVDLHQQAFEHCMARARASTHDPAFDRECTSQQEGEDLREQPDERCDSDPIDCLQLPGKQASTLCAAQPLDPNRQRHLFHRD